MSYGDFYFLSMLKSHSYIHKKEAESQCVSTFFIYSAKLKFLFCSLFNRFFNALTGSTLFHTLDS